MSFAEHIGRAYSRRSHRFDTACHGTSHSLVRGGACKRQTTVGMRKRRQCLDASHFACDIVRGASFNRDARFRLMALTDSLPTITAYSNDVAYSNDAGEMLGTRLLS